MKPALKPDERETLIAEMLEALKALLADRNGAHAASLARTAIAKATRTDDE